MKKSRQRSNSRSKSWEDRESKDEKRDYKRKGRRESTNNPAWYATDSALLRDSASYPFSEPLGTPVVLSKHCTSEGINCSTAIPGLMNIRLNPTIGYSDNSYSPVNVAAKSIYSFIRHANSGHSNYDAPDLMLYMLAMSNIYSAINWAQRLYGYVTMYNQRNRYMPEALITANKCDFDSLKNNMSNYRMGLNIIINKIASLAVPGNMTIFSRTAFLYQYVYSEGIGVKDQLYQYVPNGFFKFELDANSMGSLKYVDLSSNMTWSDILTYINNMVEAVWEQEDFGIMSGDILKAYGDNIIKLASLDEFYPLTPVYDEMVLEQIHNAKISIVVRATLDITQSTLGEYLISKPYASAPDNDAPNTLLRLDDLYDADQLLTFNSEAPTPEMVIEGTRLKASLHEKMHVNNNYLWYIESGTEIVDSVSVSIIRKSGAIMEYGINGAYPIMVAQNGQSSSQWGPNVPVDQFIYYRAFKFAPILYIPVMDANTTNDYYGIIPYGNVDNYTILSTHDIFKLHTAALLNMLNVPSIARNAITK